MAKHRDNSIYITQPVSNPEPDGGAALFQEKL